MGSTAFKRFLALVLIVVIAYILPVSWSDTLRDASLRLVRPLGHALVVRNAALHNAYNNFRQLGSLRDTNASLERQVLSLQERLADRDDLAKENALLKKQIGVTGVTKDAKKVLARIIVRDTDPLDRTLTVDLGSADGVAEGQAAVSQGALVGKVIGVTEHTAIIRTLASQRSLVQVWLSDSREKGLLVGTGTAVRLTDITQGIKVPERSVIETSGLGGSLPQGVIVGQTGATLSKPSDLSQSFSVDTSQDPAGLESVLILIGY